MSLALAAASGASILGYIDTAVRVATFLISERLPSTVENIKSFFRGKEKPDKTFEPEEAQRFIALLIIDPDLLADIKVKVEGAIKEYRKCLKKSSRPQESTACDRRAERDVCDSLNRIMDRNNNILPSDFLTNQWLSFGCVRV